MTQCPVQIGGRSIAAAKQITPNWIAVERDGHVFAELKTFQLDGDQTDNLSWGAGIDLGPGAPLALPGDLVCREEGLQRGSKVSLSGGRPPVRGSYPIMTCSISRR